MICPHCGKKMPEGTRCPNCGSSVSLAGRSSVHPEAIPGLELFAPIAASPSRPGYSRHCAIAVISIFLCAVLAAAWQISTQLRDVSPTAESVQSLQSTEPIPEVSRVCLDANLPAEAVVSSPIMPMEQLLWGQELPTLEAVGPFQFVGWNTRKDGDGSALSGGDPFTLPVQPGTTLYAQWFCPISWDQPQAEIAPAQETFPKEVLPQAEGSGAVDPNPSE